MGLISLLGLFLIFHWLMQLIYKLTDFDKPNSKIRDNLPQNKVGNFFYRMFECQFCMESHVGFIISLPFSFTVIEKWILVDFSTLFFYQNIHLIFIGWVLAAANSIIKSIKND